MPSRHFISHILSLLFTPIHSQFTSWLVWQGRVEEVVRVCVSVFSLGHFLLLSFPFPIIPCPHVTLRVISPHLSCVHFLISLLWMDSRRGIIESVCMCFICYSLISHSSTSLYPITPHPTSYFSPFHHSHFTSCLVRGDMSEALHTWESS